MSREDIQKLLGGYATGTLTPEEQQALFEAALDDQTLFDELAREQALRDLLRDPAAKAHLLTALDAKPARWWTAWWRPAAAAAAMAGVAVLAVVVVRNSAPSPPMVAITRIPSASIAIEQDRDARDGARPTAPVQEPAGDRGRTSWADLPQAQPAEEREKRRDSKELAPDKLSASPAAPAPGIGGGSPGPAAGSANVSGVPSPQPAIAPPPPADNKKPDATPVKTELAAAGQALESQASQVMKTTEAKPAPGAKALYQRGQFTGGVSAALAFADQARRQTAGQQAGGQQQLQQAPAPPPQEQFQQQQMGQQGAQQGALSRAKQAREQNAVSVTGPATPLGIRFSFGTVVGLRFETNMPVSTDRTAVHIEANDNGYLYVWVRSEGRTWRTLSNTHVSRMAPYTAPPLQPGEKEILIVFSRQARSDLIPPISSDPRTNLVERDGDVMYVVNPLTGAAGQQVQATIRLR